MLPADQIRFMLAILLSIPAGLLLKYIHSFTVRKYYSIILATLLQYYVYQNQLLWALLLHLVIYSIIKVRGRNSGFLVTLISMICLTVYHVYRYIYDYGSTNIELSFILMLYVSKYSLFAFAYQDGGLAQEKIKHEYQKEDRIIKMPSFTDFIGYLQFVPTCILNTPIDYNKYDRYMKQQGYFANIPFGLSAKKSLNDLGISLICGGLFAIQMIYFPVSYMLKPQFFQNSTIYVYFYSFWSIWLIKCKYYFIWKLSMLPIHMCGVSYQPQKSGDQFLGVQTCNPFTVQTTIHIREKINNWNMTVQQWLRKCVYDRGNFSKGTSQIVTFAVSAFWHGVYGGYYLSFFFWFMQLYASGLIFKFSQNKEHPLMKLYLKYEPYSFWVIWFIWNGLFTHNGLYFHILSASYGLNLLFFFKFAAIIFMIVCIVAFTFLSKKKKVRPADRFEGKGQ